MNFRQKEFVAVIFVLCSLFFSCRPEVINLFVKPYVVGSYMQLFTVLNLPLSRFPSIIDYFRDLELVDEAYILLILLS